MIDSRDRRGNGGAMSALYAPLVVARSGSGETPAVDADSSEECLHWNG